MRQSPPSKSESKELIAKKFNAGMAADSSAIRSLKVNALNMQDHEADPSPEMKDIADSFGQEESAERMFVVHEGEHVAGYLTVAKMEGGIRITRLRFDDGAQAQSVIDALMIQLEDYMRIKKAGRLAIDTEVPSDDLVNYCLANKFTVEDSGKHMWKQLEGV